MNHHRRNTVCMRKVGETVAVEFVGSVITGTLTQVSTPTTGQIVVIHDGTRSFVTDAGNIRG
jgi:2-C-methyl-D-erythritol 4-phosphate cytidylyltransferase